MNEHFTVYIREELHSYIDEYAEKYHFTIEEFVNMLVALAMNSLWNGEFAEMLLKQLVEPFVDWTNVMETEKAEARRRSGD